MKKLLLIAALILCSGHDWYGNKTTPGGGSCCNGDNKTGDCKAVLAYPDPETGTWIAIYDGRKYPVPDWAIHPDEENPEPFQASACVYHNQVICFWRKKTGG